jgi:uncharacterized ion transporter superfamily protein YfcC
MTDTPQHGPEPGGAAAARWQMPDTLMILFTLAVLAWAATWVFVPGAFTVAGDPARIVPGSFMHAPGPIPAPLFGDAARTGFIDFLFAGLVTGDRNSAAVGLMAFIIVLGGVFGMVMKTGAIDAGLNAALPDGKVRGEGLIFSLCIAFSLAGAVFGMSEEAIALTLLLAPALTRAGYDSATAVLACYGASQVGFATSWMNPFSVIVAQSIAGLPPMSGLELRAALWLGFTLLAALFIARHARAVRLGQRAPLGTAPARAEAGAAPIGPFTPAHMLIMLTVACGIGWVAWGVTARGYYLPEIAAQFFAVGIVTVLIAHFGRIARAGTMAEAFRDGAAQLLPAALVVGAAKGILLILGGDDPAQVSLLNSLLAALGHITAAMPEWLTAWGMYMVQSFINLFVASGSGQASVTMPIMAPLADLSGVTRQTAVLAFQLGDGFTDLVNPTSAVLMACLAAGRIGFGDWLAFIWRPVLGLVAIASAVMVAAHLGGY